jgi:multiple antibiotic resistance protein
MPACLGLVSAARRGWRMIVEYSTSTLVALMVVVDPPALAPIFIAVTEGMSPAEKRQVAARASIIATLVLAFFAMVGAPLLGALAISLPAFRIAGGLLLFCIAFEMVFERRNQRKSTAASIAVDADHIRNVAAFPLAIPLMAGPGAITAAILLAGKAEQPLEIAALIAVIGCVTATCYLVCRLSERISHWLGVTGNIVVTRLLGIILAAMAVQFVLDGIKASFLVS